MQARPGFVRRFVLATTKLTKRSFVLALLARSAYFANKSSICTQSSPRKSAYFVSTKCLLCFAFSFECTNKAKLCTCFERTVFYKYKYKSGPLLALFLGLACKTCLVLANRGKVLILLARSAYFVSTKCLLC